MATLNGKRCVDLHGKVCTLFEKTCPKNKCAFFCSVKNFQRANKKKKKGVKDFLSIIKK